MEKLIHNSKFLILNSLIFLFPLFFLPVTGEFFVTNKFYLLAFFALVLIVVSTVQLLVSKKVAWYNIPTDMPLLLFLSAVSLSLLFSSPNKFAGLLNPTSGLAMFFSLGVIYFFLSRSSSSVMKQWVNITMKASSLVLSVITIIFFFQPLKNANLPFNLQFLKNPSFTPLGSQLELAIFLGFLLVYQLAYLITMKQFNNLTIEKKLFNFLLTLINLIALSFTAFSLFKDPLLLPPLSTSWFAALETMKSIKSAIFGVGIDNFSGIFTKVKDLNYNQLSLWQIASFNFSRTTILHIMTEAGIFGLLSFVFLLLAAIRITMKQFNNLTIRPFIFLFYYLLICLFVLPPSLITFFLLFLTIGLISNPTDSTGLAAKTSAEADLSDLPFLYFGLALLPFIFTGFASYFLGRSFLAEYYFKKSINGLANNNAKEVYDNMRQARIFNPNDEKYALNFSQVNLLIAQNISRQEKVSEAERQTIAQAVQASISEGKQLIRLNPDKAQYYANLANVYKSIISIVSGADVWSISSYQRAVILDPTNPFYRLNLGGIYYLLGRYEEASRFFEQAVSLKPDWSNGYYNLAWSYYQDKQYDKAAAAMQNVTKLIDKKASPKDWEKANKDLEDFKNKLADAEKEPTAEGELSLPKPQPTIEPKIELPKEASPEAR